MAKIMTAGSKGQLVIPAEMRQQLGISPGDQVVLELTEEGVMLTPRAQHLRRLRGKYAYLPGSMAAELHQERRQQAQEMD